MGSVMSVPLPGSESDPCNVEVLGDPTVTISQPHFPLIFFKENLY